MIAAARTVSAKPARSFQVRSHSRRHGLVQNLLPKVRQATASPHLTGPKQGRQARAKDQVDDVVGLDQVANHLPKGPDQREVAEVAKLCLEVLDASAGATKQPLEPRVRTEGSATMRSGARRSQRRGLFFGLKLEAPSGKVSSSRCSQVAQTTCQELASTLHSNSGYHGPWVHMSLEDQFIWVKLPQRELLT